MSFLSIVPARFQDSLPRPNFIRLHWTYFICTTLFFSVIFYVSSRPHEHVAYIDSLFLVIAAMTQAGMNTVNLSSLNTFQQCILALLIICGNQISVSAVVVWVRKGSFEKRFKQAAELERQQAERNGLFGDASGADYPAYLQSKPQTLHLGQSMKHPLGTDIH
jgi:Trk-type K+ transport system membrane component